jgi:tetratricopeptide (TPR) repeat protein
VLAGTLLVPTTLRVPEWRSSITLWEADTERPGDHPSRWYKLGIAYGKAGRFTDAEAAFDHQLVLRPDDQVALARRLVASLAADGSFTAADAAAAKTLDPPPDTPEAWRQAMEALVAAGRSDLAVRAAEHADR